MSEINVFIYIYFMYLKNLFYFQTFVVYKKYFSAKKCRKNTLQKSGSEIMFSFPDFGVFKKKKHEKKKVKKQIFSWSEKHILNSRHLRSLINVFYFQTFGVYKKCFFFHKKC